MRHSRVGHPLLSSRARLRSVTPTSHRRQDTPAAYRPSSYSTAKKPPRSSSHAAPSDYTEPPRKKRRSIIPILLIIIGIGLIVAAAAIFINAQIGYKQASESYQKIEEQYAPAKDASGVPVIDFNALAQTNPEVVGWIYAPGTNINYPVVQATDNSKYLNTLFDGTSNASGAIFLDYEDNAPGMVDQQTTIYGHHMNDGSMFNVISDTTDHATFDSIEYVYYITRDATYKLRPLATKVVEDTYAKARIPNFEGDDGLKNYLSEMLDGASAVAKRCHRSCCFGNQGRNACDLSFVIAEQHACCHGAHAGRGISCSRVAKKAPFQIGYSTTVREK